MKKQNFYTLRRINNKPAPVLVSGYSDDRFYYYKMDGGGLWFAILPENGLSIAQGTTRKEAANAAHAPKISEILKRHAEHIEKTTKEFNKLMWEAGLA